MTALSSVTLTAGQFAGFLLVIVCALGAAAAILDLDVGVLTRQRRRSPFLERERDLAANLGWRWRTWVAVRVALVVTGVGLGLLSRIWILVLVGGLVGTLGFRFALAGRAASRRLRVERAFLGRLRDLRDRMAVGNQSLDTALAEIGRNPGPELEYVLAPLARGGSVLDNIVAVGLRARSPVVEYACAVLLWTRSRSLDALIAAIDGLLLPVGEAQLAVQEEASVTLTQQRAVTIAMSVLMLVMFAVVVRVDTFRHFYQSLTGNLVLVAVVVLFALLVALLGAIVRVRSWTRWDLQRLADEQERLGAQ
ncbi:MAG: hypothetical protein JF886_05265 [Candidatus Dormibacteraeota bacterium]|uniref:Type II secretion system protein GspF domain-containing protein n=1 Tax=Candidatus Aeolococcus gillhamiae TaxID=3127015 RepID=A0A2W5ZAT3_9BACT|nr:hypothetical protein [Candidatus Dormibacteraeota bacterium]PZR79935.1 MAG: hypothetical protein DLM65_09420 [Candidatus Dormibacter sp. RRmetagenome_bin12]